MNFGKPPKEVIENQEEKSVKKRKSRKLSHEIIFIFDEQGSLLRNQKVTDLLKKNRHYKTKVIISSQYIHDLQPGALKQLDYMIVFGGQPEDKLKLIHKHLDLSFSFDMFHNIYKQATSKCFSFLYIYTVNAALYTLL